MTSEFCENIAAVAVDILANGEYSVWQIEDIEGDLEAISNGTVHAQAEER